MQRLLVGIGPSSGQAPRIDDFLRHHRIEVDPVRVLPVDPHRVDGRIPEAGVRFGELRIFRSVLGEPLFGGADRVLRRDGVDVSPLVRVHRIDLEIQLPVFVRKKFHSGVVRSVGGRVEHGVADRSSLQGLHQVAAAVHRGPHQAEIEKISGQDRRVHHGVEGELRVELDAHPAPEQTRRRIRVDDQGHSAFRRGQLQRCWCCLIGVGHRFPVHDGNDVHDAAFSSVFSALDAGAKVQARFDVGTVAVVLLIDENAAVRSSERDPGKVNYGLGLRHLQSPPFMPAVMACCRAGGSVTSVRP